MADKKEMTYTQKELASIFVNLVFLSINAIALIGMVIILAGWMTPEDINRPVVFFIVFSIIAATVGAAGWLVIFLEGIKIEEEEN